MGVRHRARALAFSDAHKSWALSAVSQRSRGGTQHVSSTASAEELDDDSRDVEDFKRHRDCLKGPTSGDFVPVKKVPNRKFILGFFMHSEKEFTRRVGGFVASACSSAHLRAVAASENKPRFQIRHRDPPGG